MPPLLSVRLLPLLLCVLHAGPGRYGNRSVFSSILAQRRDCSKFGNPETSDDTPQAVAGGLIQSNPYIYMIRNGEK